VRFWLGVLVVVIAMAIPRVHAAQESRPSFADFLARGIRPEIVDAALADVAEPLAVVLERDRTQAETVLSLEKYIERRLTTKLVKAGRDASAKHRTLLAEVSAAYGVPAEIIVGIWGMESNFGGFSGIRPTIAALATLAWDPRRAAYFRGELFAALDILNRNDIEVSRMRGSWAGAMGQLQFMPSSYLQFAQDYDGDGRRDIWSSSPDIFASVGNYLNGKGWVEGERWGREVRVPEAVAGTISATVARRAGTCRATRDMTVALPIAQWQALGVRLSNGAPLPADAPEAALVSGASRHFLVHHNYDALLEYNCAHAYAISVGMLADRIASNEPRPSTKKARASSKARPSKAKPKVRLKPDPTPPKAKKTKARKR